MNTSLFFPTTVIVCSLREKHRTQDTMRVSASVSTATKSIQHWHTWHTPGQFCRQNVVLLLDKQGFYLGVSHRGMLQVRIGNILFLHLN